MRHTKNNIEVLGGIHPDDFESDDLKLSTIIVTKNRMTNKEAFHFIKEANLDDEVTINELFFEDSRFELWNGNEIIGCCSFQNSIYESCKPKNEWTALMSLNGVILKPLYRKRGLALQLALLIGPHVKNELLSRFLTKQEKSKADIRTIYFTFTADFETSEGEKFFDNLIDFTLCEVSLKDFKSLLNCDCYISIDSGY